MSSPSMQMLLETLPQQGTVEWIGIRPEKRGAIRVVNEVEAHTGSGLAGDHFNGSYSTKRQVTLIQYEHIVSVASFLHRQHLDPVLLRRNILVKGINLLALKNKTFLAGSSVLQMTGLCHPCSRMEEALGPGGYNAMRGHGGITARILESGHIRVGCTVQPV
jgi:MOSC domain-containing protein YiiM